MTKSAIILAGGKGTRFNGTVKELLPISDTESVIDCSINAVKVWNADRIIIVSNPDKISYHVKHFNQDKYKDLNILFKINSAGEMWESLCKGMEDATEQNLMLMADTVFNPHDLQYMSDTPLAFGVFQTYATGNFSVFYNGIIRTKDQNLTGPLSAWGCVLFTKDVVQYWKNDLYSDYDAAFNAAMEVFDYSAFNITPYFDLGTLGRYIEYLNKHYV